MSVKDLYPLAENAPDRVKTPTGKLLSDITLDAVLAGEVTAADLAITPEALHLQAEIALAGGRRTLAENFHRAAELVAIPQDVIMETYEMLRPGRADLEMLHAQADVLRSIYKAELLAKFIEEAATVYERRGIFEKRY
ncbi:MULTISPECIES: diol dehydratase small subunit [Ruegeria]|uniref:diol dehydratase small subunit n=1 Tax=Ruegeria TaxID=97050 RepID=UPI001481065A|nr:MULTISPECIES: diol dehydratase small subunit [Ruegeria]